MRWAAIVGGLLLMLIGGVWTLQGANVLLGSVMTGDRFWLVTGIVVFVLGAALAIWGWRRRA